MGLPPQNALVWKVCITLLHLLSISCTIIRIGHQCRIGHLWWDDHLVGMIVVVDCIYLITMWLRLKNGDLSWNTPGPNTFMYSEWFAGFLYYTVLWICIALSVAKIFLPGHPFRRLTFYFIGLLFLFYLTNILTMTFSCPGSPWWQLKFQNCMAFASGASIDTVIGATLDFTADAILVIAPVMMLWRIKFPPSQRILILALFSSSVLTILASAMYCSVWYAAGRLGSDSHLIFTMMGQLQAAVGLLTSNLLVVVMLIYRKLRKSNSNGNTPRAPDPLVEDDENIITSRDPASDEVDPNQFTRTSVPSYTIITQLSESAVNPGSSENSENSDLSSALHSSLGKTTSEA
ncbi:hypothetical protein BDZ97DRAFT_113498 [Flammula alnicola]|nr:hypothetical protein BDZ97DRAFT_113498 [Flammula alnicola]